MIPVLLAVVVLDLPLGPASEDEARAIAAPHVHAEPIDGGPFHLWDIRLQPRSISYLVAKPGESPEVVVRLDLDRAPSRDRGAVTVEPAPGVDAPSRAARRAGDVLASALRRRVELGEVTVRETGIAPGTGPGEGEEPPATPAIGSPPAPKPLPGEPPPQGMPEEMAVLLLLALGVSLLLALPRARRSLPPVPRSSLALLGVVTAAVAIVLFALEDTVVHANGHGWDTVRASLGFERSPWPAWSRYGPMHLELTHLFGFAAPFGREPFLASRIAAVLALPAIYALALLLFERPAPALLAAGLLGVSAPFLYAGRGEAGTTPGLLLLLLAALLAGLAGRTRSLLVLAAAAIAAGALASFRLMGPILAPAAASLALVVPADPRIHRPVWWKAWLAVAGLVAVMLSLPHVWSMASMMSAELSAREHAGVVPATLLDSPLWTPTALVLAAVVGAAALARVRPWLALVLVAWAALGVLAPASSAAFYQDQARYQVYAMPAVVLLAAGGAGVLLSRLGAFGPPLVFAGLVGIAWGNLLPGRALGEEGAEVAQLRHLRRIVTALPPASDLAVPVETKGRARTALPDAELFGARPDVRVLSVAEARSRGEHDRKRPLSYYEPLSCAARYPGEHAGVATDCVVAREVFGLEPQDVLAVDPELPPDLAVEVAAESTVFQPTRGDPGQWNPRPFVDAPVRIGLHRVVSRDP